MRRVLFPIALALAAAVPASQRVAACGDKFLHTGGGLFQNVYAPAHSGICSGFCAARSSGAARCSRTRNFNPRSVEWGTRWSSSSTKGASVRR